MEDKSDKQNKLDLLAEFLERCEHPPHELTVRIFEEMAEENIQS